MAWTNPTTQVTGTLITATVWNRDITDDLLFLYNNPACRVYNSANISIPNNTITTLTFDSERFDTDTIHSTSSNTGRLTCQTAGVYHIFCHYLYATNPADSETWFELNGATNILYTRTIASELGANRSTLYKLAAADYVQVKVRQVSGAAVNINAAGNYSPEFGMVRVGTG